MFEIIPNWHPFFVHFSIGLLLTAAVLHVLVLVVGNTTTQRSLTTVANWNLWVGIGFAVITVIAGWFAFNSVNHDTPSHLVMLEHRKWAVATTIVFVALGLWSFMRAKNSKPIALPLTAAVVVAAGLLLTTGWYGGELVYRHGLGVMSLPDQSDHSHAEGVAHDHGSGAGHGADGHHDMSKGDHHDSLDNAKEAHGHGGDHNDSGHSHDEGKAPGHTPASGGHDSID